MESLNADINPEVRYRSFALAETFETLMARSAQVYLQVKFLGYSDTMDDYEQRKLRIFNQLNFFQALTGLLVPLLAILLPGKIPVFSWVIACWPAGINIVVLGLNSFHKKEAALVSYFIFYPLCLCIIYLNGMNPGIELQFILLIILSVFLLNDIGMMLFTIGLSMISFFVLSVVLDHFIYEIKSDNKLIYLLNKLISLVFVFYGLFLIKKENTIYQFNILSRQEKLHAKNLEIEKQKEKISEHVTLLEKQKQELADLNAFKNKLFSIISHDLKTPMYAIRAIFQNMHQYNVPAGQIKEMLPDILNDLNYTTSLMENLLQWAKSQMNADNVCLESVNICDLITDVTRLLRLQLEAKGLSLEIEANPKDFVFADRNMIHLVLRNLLSNAIKFTAKGGHIKIGLRSFRSSFEVYVQDAGTGISEEEIKKIKQKVFYTTTGTCSETGTGLGLMLCNEFLAKNNSWLDIKSTVGKGSKFSFLLPKSINNNSN